MFIEMFPIRERAYDYEPLAVPRHFQVVLPLDLEHRRKRRIVVYGKDHTQGARKLV